jgi:hypothetical protein
MAATLRRRTEDVVPITTEAMPVTVDDRVMPALRPDRLLELSSGLWAVDVSQPVAAVLDPATGALRDLVSWRTLPAAQAKTDWPRPQLMGDGDALWIQEQPTAPLVRVTRHGIATAVWTKGLYLAACHAGVAWCAQWSRTQELVHGADAQPIGWSGMDRLLRVDADGRSTEILVDAPVRHVYATPEAAWVWLDVEPWSLDGLGADSYLVVWSRRWIRLPWDEQQPDELQAAVHGQESGQESGPNPGQPLNDPEAGRWPDPWYEPSSPATVAAAGCTWRLGWSTQVRTERGGLWRRGSHRWPTDCVTDRPVSSAPGRTPSWSGRSRSRPDPGSGCAAGCRCTTSSAGSASRSTPRSI